MNMGTNLTDLLLYDLLTWIGQSKDLNRYSHLLKGQDLVQDKGL